MRTDQLITRSRPASGIRKAHNKRMGSLRDTMMHNPLLQSERLGSAKFSNFVCFTQSDEMTHGIKSPPRSLDQTAAAAVGAWQTHPAKRPASGLNYLLHRPELGKTHKGQMIANVDEANHGARRPGSARPDGWQQPTLSAEGILLTKQADVDPWDVEILNINRPSSYVRPSTARVKEMPWLRPGMTFGMVGSGLRKHGGSNMGNLMAHSDLNAWVNRKRGLLNRAREQPLTLVDI